MHHKVQLLSTAWLDQALVDKAAQANMVLDVIPFIKVSTIANDKLKAEIALLYKQPLNIVFTSANAVMSVVANAGEEQPNWRIYCVGTATKKEVLKYYSSSKVEGTASDAAALAEVVKNRHVKDVVFFCGDKRMDTLPLILQNAGVVVQEIIVYKTEEIPQKISKKYDGILFFSPSGVNSFFSLNQVEASTVLFAIGNTTAKAIKEQTDNKVITSESASKEILAESAINYFYKQAIAKHE